MSNGRARRVLIAVPGVDVERLGSLLGEDVESAGEAVVSEADVIALPESATRGDLAGAARVVRVPPSASFPDGRLEPWVASQVTRALRRVAEPERHESPGVARVATEGAYEHPDLEFGMTATFGVMLFKPGTIVTVEAVEDLAERAAECGYSIILGRTVSPGELVATGVVRRHYGAHWNIARAGRLQPEERLHLLRIYDRPGFHERFGIGAPEVEVMPVLEYVERSVVTVEVINAWSEASAKAHGLSSGSFDGPNELGDLTYVNLFVPPDGSGPPVFLLNPHMPSVTGWFEHGPTPLVALLLGTSDERALEWSRMREEFNGNSDPSTSPLGSLRRDLWEGLWPLRYVEEIDVGQARNGVHLSNGPVESVREALLWFGIGPDDTATGRALTDACGDTTDFLEAEYLNVAGRTRVLVDITRNLTTAQAAALLSSGRRLSIREQAANGPTIRRIDLAHRVAGELSRDDDVVAVLVGGSVALNRASVDSDLDLIVITSRPDRPGAIERIVRSGVVVEMEWLFREEALALAAGGRDSDVRELRRSARLGLALPVVDLRGVADELAARARLASPDLESAGVRLVDAYAAFVGVADRTPREPTAYWAALRGLYDVIAFLLLLASPLRFQKPKWVLADLVETGNADVGAALMRAYGVDDDPTAAARTVEACTRIIETVATHLDLPSAETVRELGLIAEYPEYSYLCQCVDDARSLIADKRWADAAYTAKFSVRMAAAMSEGRAEAGGQGAAELGRLTAVIFTHDGTNPPLNEPALEACLEHLDRCKDQLFAPDRT